MNNNPLDKLLPSETIENFQKERVTPEVYKSLYKYRFHILAYFLILSFVTTDFFVFLLFCLFAYFIYYGIQFIPPGHVGLFEKLGKYISTVGPGVHFAFLGVSQLIPISMETRSIVLKNLVIYSEVEMEDFQVYGGIFYRVIDPVKFRYSLFDPENSVAFSSRKILSSLLSNYRVADGDKIIDELSTIFIQKLDNEYKNNGIKIEKVSFAVKSPQSELLELTREDIFDPPLGDIRERVIQETTTQQSLNQATEKFPEQKASPYLVNSFNEQNSPLLNPNSPQNTPWQPIKQDNESRDTVFGLFFAVLAILLVYYHFSTR